MSKYGLGVVHTDEKSYREQWATLTGRSEKDVYIPRALRKAEARQTSASLSVEALRTTPILEPKPPQPQEPENN